MKDATKKNLSGYRLQYLEVFNWGTFDSSQGHVHRVEPLGNTSLLIGQNGSGKSTIVDAILTLLVQPGVRNYNVAAGAKKRERDERSYLHGACGRSSDDEVGSIAQFLRPGNDHYSILLACFASQETQSTFTLAQFLYLQSDGSVEKLYLFSKDARSIEQDLARLNKADRIKSELARRGFQVTTKYSEYSSWITAMTSWRGKAMDMFNQTVAVKDIQSLNLFVREHMLEARPWSDKVDHLLTHFTQLSQAYQSLVRIRRQREMAEPIERLAHRLKELEVTMSRRERVLNALEAFVRHKAILLMTPTLDEHRLLLEQTIERKRVLGVEIESLDEQHRHYLNEMENGSSDRARQLPRLIELESLQADAKAKSAHRLAQGLQQLGIQGELQTRNGFEKIQKQLLAVKASLANELKEADHAKTELSIAIASKRDALDKERSEGRALESRGGNLPIWLADVRSKMLEELKLAERDLPFASELISVAPDQGTWQASIEMVLRPFALTLLVPAAHYDAVSRYIDKNRLVDSTGRGQRLSYTLVTESAPATSAVPPLHPRSLILKLKLRQSHPLHHWLLRELQRRFDYRCCETMEEFQKESKLAVTKERHLKSLDHRHEKDDRSFLVDRRNYVLGWDNREKKQSLAEQIERLQRELTEQLAAMQAIESKIELLQQKRFALMEVSQVGSFDLIDVERHQGAIAVLEKELADLDRGSVDRQGYREKLERVTQRKLQATASRDQAMAEEGRLLHQIKEASRWIDTAKGHLEKARSSGLLEQYEPSFAELEKSLSSQELSFDDLHRFEREQAKSLQLELQHLESQRDPIRLEITRSLQRFLTEFPEHRSDLEADIRYLDGFLALLNQIREEDLPKYELRFKERLNEKVIQEIGVFHASLQSERMEIKNKIETLNRSLAQLEYRPGTFMKLEPREVQDQEIRQFLSMLRDCLTEVSSVESKEDEARYRTIDKLLERLREDERWRDKVTDVRRWFDFAAREIDRNTGLERSFYEDSSGQSGGEKAKLAFTILVAAIAYQYDLAPQQKDRFHFVVVDEMFSKVDDQHAEYALKLFEKFGLQLLIVAPLDAKARVTEPYVGCYLQTVKDDATKKSQIYSMTSLEYNESLVGVATKAADKRLVRWDGPHKTRGPRRPK